MKNSQHRIDYHSIRREAEWSSNGKRRFKLGRFWSDQPICTVVGLNPSTANEENDDPTCKRLISLLSRQGYGGYWLVNLITNATPNPLKLNKSGRRLSARNKQAVETAVAQSENVVLAWGAHGVKYNHRLKVYEMVSEPLCFGVTKDGEPRHPLYIPNSTALTLFSF